MRLLVIGNFLSAKRGTRFYCEDLAERLAAKGHGVLTASDRPGRRGRFCDMLVTVWRRRTDYDQAIVACYSGAGFLWADSCGYLLRWLGKPFMLVLHGGALPEFHNRHPLRVQRLLRAATVLVTPSRYLQNCFAPIRSDIRYLPNALELGRYNQRESSPDRLRLVWLRAFQADYCPEMAVEVLARLAEFHPEATLAMIGPDRGDGSLAACRQRAEQLGVADRISWVGAVSKAEVPARLADADIFLNTTRYESFGIALLEAAACGLPIVSTRVGEIPWLWLDGEELMMVEPGDAAAMAEAVRRIVEDADFAARLSCQARRRAEAYDWSVILPQWEALLAEAAGA